MKRTLKLILFTFLLISVTKLSVAQKSSTAVMEVRVEVISGSSIALNSSGKLEAGWEKYNQGNDYDIQVGDFSVTLPDEVEIISEIDDELNLTNGTNTIDFSTKIDQVKNDDGTITFSVKGKTETDKIESTGHYSGKKTATIHYIL